MDKVFCITASTFGVFFIFLAIVLTCGIPLEYVPSFLLGEIDKARKIECIAGKKMYKKLNIEQKVALEELQDCYGYEHNNCVDSSIIKQLNSYVDLSCNEKKKLYDDAGMVRLKNALMDQ
jgi:hypothetical protein